MMKIPLIAKLVGGALLFHEVTKNNTTPTPGGVIPGTGGIPTTDPTLDPNAAPMFLWNSPTRGWVPVNKYNMAALLRAHPDWIPTAHQLQLLINYGLYVQHQDLKTAFINAINLGTGIGKNFRMLDGSPIANSSNVTQTSHSGFDAVMSTIGQIFRAVDTIKGIMPV